MRVAMFVLTVGLALVAADARAAVPAEGWEFVGQIQADSVEVQARVTGYVTQVAVEEGDTVAKGDLLVEIDPRPYGLALGAAKARLKAAEAKLQSAQLKTAHAKKLLDKKFVSKIELGLKAAAEAEARAAVLVAKMEVERAELTLSWTRITAPLNGRVSRVPTTEGDLVVANQTHIMTVASTEPLYVSFNVPVSRVLQLRRAGLAAPEKLNVAVVGFAGEEGHPHTAKLDLIAPRVTPQTGTVRFRATIPNPKDILLPGMSARVRLTLLPK